jgi:succinoglycan biosynthesis protein ExoM
MLSNLLNKLQNQVVDGIFSYSAIVVDNDADKSAFVIVREWQKKSKVAIWYEVVQEQNIALARNRAVQKASGNFIAFIDDDEFPIESWLLNLYKSLTKYKVDGALGPVRPYYPETTPKWLMKSKLCEREEYKTGTILHWGQTRTGNTLLSKKLFENKSHWSNPAFGKTGGEDTIFFKKQHENGKTFVWCNEAVVYEIVPPDRCTKIFHVRKNLRIGCGVGENLRKQEAEFSPPNRKTKRNKFVVHEKIVTVLPRQIFLLSKSIIWIVITAFLLPIAVIWGEAYCARLLAKLSYNFGVVSGFLGFVIIRYRA